MQINTLPPSFPQALVPPPPGFRPDEEEGTPATGAAPFSEQQPPGDGENTAAGLSVLELPQIAFPVPTAPSVGSPPPADGEPVQVSPPPGAPIPGIPQEVPAASQPVPAHASGQTSAPATARSSVQASPVPSDSGDSSPSGLPEGAGPKSVDHAGAGPKSVDHAGAGEGEDSRELSEEEQEEVEELKKRDREVREHEQAHLAAAGQYARGGAQFEYQTGPDGRRYAVGGEVSVDTSKVPDDPQATIRKSQAIYRAAMAPAEPSSQDRRVAAKARQMQSQAQAEVAAERRGASEGGEAGDGEESTRAGSTDAGVGAGAGMAPAGGSTTAPQEGGARGGENPVPAGDFDLPEAGEIDAGTFDKAGFAGQVLDLLA